MPKRSTSKRKSVKTAASSQPAFPATLHVPPPPEPPSEGLILDRPSPAWADYAEACVQHARDVNALLLQHSEQRITAADAREPIAYRAQHRAAPGNGAAIERSHRQVKDAQGRIGNPFIVNDTLRALHSKGRIDDAQLAAGRQFEEDFRRANIDPMKAADLARVPSQMVGAISDSACDYRKRIGRALDRLGGMTSSLGRVCWHVLGEGQTLAEYARAGEGYMRPESASELLRAALEILAGDGR